MDKKKLLTVAGAVGILACGACLPPPLPRHAPPRPPVLIRLEGIHSLRVEVVNVSPGHQLDPAALAQRIADRLNEQSSRMNIAVNAHVGKNVGGGDAVLAITILGETVETLTPTKIRILIQDSATLTRLDGALVWRETEAGTSIARNVAEGYPADAWKDPGLLNGVEKALSNWLVFRMLVIVDPNR